MALADSKTSVVGSAVIGTTSVTEFSSNCSDGKVTELSGSGVSKVLSL